MCQRQGGYSGGLAVVAANSAQEAFKTFFEDKEYSWMRYDYEIGKITDDFTNWRSDYYSIELWFERKELTANVNEPCVIMEGGYSE